MSGINGGFVVIERLNGFFDTGSVANCSAIGVLAVLSCTASGICGSEYDQFACGGGESLFAMLLLS
jgi:hypothetical protein